MIKRVKFFQQTADQKKFPQETALTGKSTARNWTKIKNLAPEDKIKPLISKSVKRKKIIYVFKTFLFNIFLQKHSRQC